MFRSATFKLTIWYTTVIMLVSISFSVAIFFMASREIASGVRRQLARPHFGYPPPGEMIDEDFLRDQLIASENNIKLNLFYINGVVLLLAGLGSYYWARRTLTPIEEAMAAQNRFTSDASHELRTPLAALRTEIEVALREGNLTKAEATKLLKSNLEEVEKLSQLAEQLLTLTNFNEDKLELSPIDSRDLVTSAVDMVDKLAAKKNISIETQIEDFVFSADQAALRRVLIILLDNAVKFSPKDSQVEFKVGQTNQQAVFVVKDHGIGIKAEDQARVFERFYRTDKARTRQKSNGHGLGLSIAKKIVELHDGEISLKSKPDQGATFTVRLPKSHK